MNQKIAKYERKKIRQFVCTLLSNMKFVDRIRFVFTGNYVKPLRKTAQNLGGARKVSKDD